MLSRKGIIVGSNKNKDDDLTCRKPQAAATSKTPAPSSSASSSPSTVPNKQIKRKAEEESKDYLRRKHNIIKSTIRTDYQPDICKDYKETGFCGFGDSCKFLHDRSDYKHGWQIDQDYAKSQNEKKVDDRLTKDSDEKEAKDDDESDIRCPICKELYKSPIMTKCKHYFCSDCAEKECIQKCFTCGQPTNGIFKFSKPKAKK